MSEAEQSGAGRREVAYRIFAAEFNDADFSFSESDEERAPSYVVTPTGARANRLFIVGVLTEVEQVSEDVLRGRVVDPTGAFVLYAGQYQPDEQAFLERAGPPTFVAVTGKARTFQPEDSEQVFTSIRPESISEVDAQTRDRWTVQAAEHTTERIGWMAQAMTLNTGEGLREMLVERGTDDGLAHGIELALAEYETTPTYLDALREMSLDAARIVAGKKDEITAHSVAPDAAGDMTAEELAARVSVDIEEPSPVSAASTEGTEPAGTQASDATETEQTDAATETEPAETDTGVADSTPGEPEPTVESTEKTTEPATHSEESATTGADSSDSQPAEEQTPGTAPTANDEDSSAVADSDAEDAGDLGDFEPEEFELQEETREEVEEEYGTEFQAGTEVDEPGEAGIETPEEISDEPPTSDPDTAAEEETGEGTEESRAPPEQEDAADDAAEPETETADHQARDTGDTDEPEEEEPDDLQAAVVELMGELDTGDGADREDLIAEMDARHGTDRETVEEAIQDALMDGQCYEPDDSLLKPI